MLTPRMRRLYYVMGSGKLMSKTTCARKDDGYAVTNKLARGETVNMREIGLLPELASSGLFCPSYEGRRFSRHFVCDLKGMEPLGFCLNRIADLPTMLSIALQAVAAMGVCELHGMRTDNLALDMYGVYLDSVRQRLWFIYWPIVNPRQGYYPNAFFKELAAGAKLASEDRGRLGEYMRYLDGDKPFSRDSFSQIAMGMLEGAAMPAGQGAGLDPLLIMRQGLFGNGSASQDAVSQQRMAESRFGSPSGFGTSPLADGGATVGDAHLGVPFASGATVGDAHLGVPFASGAGAGSPPASAADATMGAAAGATGSAALSPRPQKPSASQDAGHGAPPPVKGGPGDGNRAKPDGRLAGIAAFPKDIAAGKYERRMSAFLIRLSNTEIIPISKGILDIGRDRDSADYVISDNETVSRKHATLFVRDGRHYIVDNGSTNKTYVHDTEIPPFEEVEILSGARIRLSSETFIFFK